jgi:23S rRNA (cytidine1920-2'-O)/16S rRNA (cytidine1409-2'-O)-methyltransferase
VRLDELLVERGLAASRAEASRLILAGRVRVGDAAGAKAGRMLPADAPVELVAVSPYVSRGGEKLAGALEALGVSVEGRLCLDVGASTGGFTDCLLLRGARRVYAVDVGHGQLHPRLRVDSRVVVLEGINARHLQPSQLGERPTLATVDVSFISLEKVLPAIVASLGVPGEILALVKPQFEVGRGQVGKGGVVRDPELHRQAVSRVAARAGAEGLAVRGVIASSLRGPKGNREFFLLLGRGGTEPGGLVGSELDAAVERALA